MIIQIKQLRIRMNRHGSIIPKLDMDIANFSTFIEIFVQFVKLQLFRKYFFSTDFPTAEFFTVNNFQHGINRAFWIVFNPTLKWYIEDFVLKKLKRVSTFSFLLRLIQSSFHCSLTRYASAVYKREFCKKANLYIITQCKPERSLPVLRRATLNIYRFLHNSGLFGDENRIISKSHCFS